MRWGMIALRDSRGGLLPVPVVLGEYDSEEELRSAFFSSSPRVSMIAYRVDGEAISILGGDRWFYEHGVPPSPNSPNMGRELE